MKRAEAANAVTRLVATASTFDNLGRALTRKYVDGTEKFGYSTNGLVAYTNRVGASNFFAYDAAGRRTFETNANGELIRYTNSPAGDLLSLTDGKSQTTRWHYDQYGRVTDKVDQASAQILRYIYDPNNRLTNRWSAAKGNTAYSFDPIGNLTNINYPNSADVSFACDGMNRITNMVDGIGTTKYSYDGAGQLLTEDGPFASDTVTSTYSNRLRGSLSLQQPTGSWDNGFSYDVARRLSVASSPAGYSSYAYRAGFQNRQLAQLTLPNSAYITNLYDSVARLLSTKLNNSGNGTLDSYAYVYDPANERTNLTRFSGATVAYAYDKIGQLAVANSSVNTEDRGYTYDTAWNLNWLTNNGLASQFIVDNKNELTNAPGPGTISYDANGNITNLQSSLHALYYDDENRLVDYLDTSSGAETVFIYDGLGRLRIRQEYQPGISSPSASFPIGGGVLASETRYIYDGWRVIQERDSNNIPTVSYTRGIDLSGTMQGAGGIGGLLARSDGYNSFGDWTNHSFYFADGNGNIVDMLNSSQLKVANYTYDPFGNTVSSSGTLAPTNTYRFSSKEIHLNSGLYYYGYRFYDPNLQRWINRDPIAESGGINLYDFVFESPVNQVDYLGLADGPLPNQVIPPNWPSGQGPGGLANPVRPSPSPSNPGTRSPGIVPPDPGGSGYMDNGSLDTASALSEALGMAGEALDRANFSLLYQQAIDKCKRTPPSSNGASKCCVVTVNGEKQINTGTVSWKNSSGYVADKPCCQAEQDNSPSGHGSLFPGYGPNTERFERYVNW